MHFIVRKLTQSSAEIPWVLTPAHPHPHQTEPCLYLYRKSPISDKKNIRKTQILFTLFLQANAQQCISIPLIINMVMIIWQFKLTYLV